MRLIIVSQRLDVHPRRCKGSNSGQRTPQAEGLGGSGALLHQGMGAQRRHPIRLNGEPLGEHQGTSENSLITLLFEPGFPVGPVVDFINTPWMVQAIYNVAHIFIVSMMIGVALLLLVGVNMSGEWNRKHLGDDVPEQAPGEETLLGAAGDEVPPGGVVAGSFSQEFPGADPYAGMPADEVGLPPLSEAEQEAVAREADRLADDPDARRNL